MANRPPRLRNRILACLILAWPHFVSAQSLTAPKQAREPHAAAASTGDEALRQWIREDNKLIDGILVSLTHIDRLVSEIQQMVTQLPDFPQTPRPTTTVAPIPPEKTLAAAPETSPPLGGWAPQLAGAGLLALLAFWLGRRRGLAQTTDITVFAEPETREQAAPAPVAFRHAATPPASAVPTERRANVPAAALVAPAATPPVSPTPQVVAPPAAPTIPAAEAPPLDQSDQALELAEIMLSMGLGQGATQTLAEQIRNEPKQALRHWLKLLDIYRKNGQQQEFERSAEELRQHFNVHPEDWQATPGTKRSLEDFPHIARRLTELWGKPDCLVYMRNLLDDNRGGARSGFPQAVAEELLLLNAVMRIANGFTAGS